MKAFIFALLLLVVAAQDFAPLLHSDSPDVIPGSYIVVLKKGLTVSDRDVHILQLKDAILAAASADKIGHVYNIGRFIGFAATLSDDLLKAELAHPDVQYIEANQVVSINYEVEPAAVISQVGADWGLDRVSQRSLPLDNIYYYDTTGSTVDAYIIDTGIYVDHTEFTIPGTTPPQSRALNVFNAIAGEAGTDLNGHGTHVSGTVGGTIYGLAKEVKLFGIKVLNAAGSGSYDGVIAGINYVTNNQRKPRKSVANMSLGGGISTATDSAVTESVAANISYAIAAGNNNANACNYSPARTPAAVTVGATTTTDARATFSNIGTCLDVFAPGQSITSAWIGNPNAINVISGTSMASPHVAGVLVLESERSPELLPPQLEEFIRNDGTIGVVTGAGTGSPNILLYSPW